MIYRFFFLCLCGAFSLCAGLLFPLVVSAQKGPAGQLKFPGLVQAEFIFEKAPFKQCHASTIAAGREGLVAAWFAGTREKNPDVGIWVSRKQNGHWGAPVEVANGVQNEKLRYPCWNPVLHQVENGSLLLFYKVGPSPSQWWGMLITSADGGKSWSNPHRLPEGIAGPIKNKPITLSDGRLLCGSSSEDQGWRIHLEWTSDEGKTWQRTGALNDGKTLHAIQPTILSHGNGKLQILCRTRSKKIAQSFSHDLGKTWSEFKLTSLPNSNTGIDGVSLSSGRHLLVYNHTPRGRSPINIAVSDDGLRWYAAAVLENIAGEFSYPAVIQTSDGLVHLTYTWKRSFVKHVVVDPKQLKITEIVGGKWPE